MFYEVYIDIFFAVNTILDFFVILLVKTIQHYKTTKLRMLLAAMTGSVILCLFLCVPVKKGIILQLLFYIGACTAMAALAFPEAKSFGRLKAILSLYVSSILINGIFQWLHVRFAHTTSLAFGCLLVFICIRGIYKVCTKDARQTIYDIDIRYKKQTIHIKGLWDTGNRLRSPYHQKGVSVIEYACIKDYISESLRQCIETGQLSETLGEDQEKLFFVPYETIDQKHGVMPVLVADKMWIQKEEEILEYSAPLLGISAQPVSSSHTFQIIIAAGG